MNMVLCRKKRHVANHLETQGQRDGTLSGTAWTLTPGESENGTFFRRGEAGPCFRLGTRLCCATFCRHNLLSSGTPCSCDLTASLLPDLSHGGLMYERSAAAWHTRADKRLKETATEKDNVNQFSKLGID